MKWPVVLLPFLSAACLPAYEKTKPPVTVDMSMPTGDLAGDMAKVLTCSTPSGSFISGATVSMDDVNPARGPSYRIDGCKDGDPAGVTGPTSSSTFKLSIPQDYLGESAYLIAEGSIDLGGPSSPIPRTWFAPKSPLVGKNRGFTHLWKNGYNPPKCGIRGTLAKELATATPARIDAADMDDATFAQHYSYAFGAIGFEGMSGELDEVAGTKFSINGDTSVDTAACLPKDGKCCVYYTSHWDQYCGGSGSTLIDFSATTSPKGWFAVVCKENPDAAQNRPDDLTLQQTITTATLTDRGQAYMVQFAASFPPFQVPRRLGDAVLIEYMVPSQL